MIIEMEGEYFGILVTVQPRADLLRNWASFACKLPNSNPVLVFFTVCTAECADLPELLRILPLNLSFPKEYKKKYNDLSTAIDKAIEYCIKHDIMRDILEQHRSEVARLIFKEFDEAEFLQQQQKETEDLKAEIRLAIERAEQSERQTRLVKEEAERQTKLAKEETERLRKILKEHGWSE